MRRVFRYRVVVNDRPQTVQLTGDPLHVEAARLGAGPDGQHVVDFWAEHTDGEPAVDRAFQVFGTGHQLPEGARWWGTTARTPEGLVWHLYEVDRAPRGIDRIREAALAPPGSIRFAEGGLLR